MGMDLLENEWFINIGTAIISGILLIPITIKIGSWIDNSKKQKNADKVNKEVLSILRKIVSEGQSIDFLLIEIVTNSVKQTNKIDNKFVFSEVQMMEHLITDIFDSSYITMSKKVEMTEPLKKKVYSKKIESKQNGIAKGSTSRWLTSLIFAFYVIALGALVTYVAFDEKNVSSQTDPEGSAFILVLLLTLLLGIIIVYKRVTKRSILASVSEFFGIAGDELFGEDDIENNVANNAFRPKEENNDSGKNHK